MQKPSAIKCLFLRKVSLRLSRRVAALLFSLPRWCGGKGFKWVAGLAVRCPTSDGQPIGWPATTKWWTMPNHLLAYPLAMVVPCEV